MASPLGEMGDSAMNASTPSRSSKLDGYEVTTFTTETNTNNMDHSQSSSSFISCVNNDSTPAADQENGSSSSPHKSRHSRIISGAELSPLKILSEKRKSPPTDPATRSMPPPPPSSRSPRKVSPVTRFPVKISEPPAGATAARESPSQRPSERAMSLEDAVQENEGLKRAIDIFEDEQSGLGLGNDDDDGMDTSRDEHQAEAEGDADVEAACPDDTMVSTFSTFSAVPNLTTFAQLRQSPEKRSFLGSVSGGGSRPENSPSHASSTGNTTNLLMDFTEQQRFPQKSPSKYRGNMSSSRTPPNVAATPNRHLSNLIDFDIPPMPTPRSVPSITPRELESLKSNFLSEISSLKASLSGKQAEVESLKKAVGDAEKRVGESMEQLREERDAKEQLTSEKEGWENRGREMENVLRKVKQEIMTGQREREDLEQKLDESEKRREAAEIMHQEAESKMAGMRAGKETEKLASPEKAKSPGAASTRDVEMAVERVARELHGLYKSKHETKVAALKKSYESRWEKRVRDLESQIADLSEDNDKLRVGRDATLTRVDPSSSADAEERKAQAVKDSATIKTLQADVERLDAMLENVKGDNDELRQRLEQEQVEKGELVQLAEEMMSMQSFVGSSSSQAQQQSQTQTQAQPQPTPSRLRQQENQRPEMVAKTPKAAPTDHHGQGGKGSASANRASGLRAPGSVLRAPHERNRSGGGGGGGLPRPGGGMAGRSGIMSSIEKMGNYRGRSAE